MLARGARHHVSARMKEGKSLAFLTHSVDMAAAGARVVILDRENGSDEYARRLGHVLEDRPAAAREAARERLAYFAFPLVKLTDGAALAAALAGTDLVILDSTRTFLSSLALDEDRSDDFAKFATAIIEPLFRAGIATVQLDNSGHGDSGRARGTSSKGDLADVTYTLKTTAAFDQHRRGSLRLVRSHSRFGDVGPAFTMEIGGGRFGALTAEDSPGDEARETLRPTAIMENVSRLIEETPGLSKRAILAAISSKDSYVTLALELLIADGYVRIEVAGQAHRHHLIRPYNEAEDPHRGPVAQPWPTRGPDTGEEDRGPVAPPKGTRDTGHGVEDTATVALATDDEQDDPTVVWQRTTENILVDEIARAFNATEIDKVPENAIHWDMALAAVVAGDAVETNSRGKAASS